MRPLDPKPCTILYKSNAASHIPRCFDLIQNFLTTFHIPSPPTIPSIINLEKITAGFLPCFGVSSATLKFPIRVLSLGFRHALNLCWVISHSLPVRYNLTFSLIIHAHVGSVSPCTLSHLISNRFWLLGILSCFHLRHPNLSQYAASFSHQYRKSLLGFLWRFYQIFSPGLPLFSIKHCEYGKLIAKSTEVIK